METLHFFNDIPPIHVAEDGPLNFDYSGWPNYTQDYSQMDYSRYPGTKMVQVFGEDLPIDEQNTQDMSSMQRFFHASPPFAPGCLNTDFKPSTLSHHQQYFEHNRTLEPQSPWPSPKEHQRQCSPDDTIWSASSGSWTASPQDEFRSSNMFARYAMAGQLDFRPNNMSYPDHPEIDTPLVAPPMSGGSGIALRQIQYAPDEEPELSVEDSDLKIEFVYEQETMSLKMEVDDGDDSALGESIRDAESVQPLARDEYASDSDFQPSKSSATSKRHRRRTSQSSSGFCSKLTTRRRSSGTRTVPNAPGFSSGRVSKKGRSSVSSPTGITGKASGAGGNTHNAIRAFPCPLAQYSCNSTFASKNEWKRHVSTQHIRLGFWRCDLCLPTPESSNTTSVYFNDFNRKDLFTQHLRRMHAAPAHPIGRNNQREYPVTEDNLADHQTRCYQQLRSPPPKSDCLFCDRKFIEPGAWEERMEHIGRHLEKDRKAGGHPIDIKDWQRDEELEQWFVAEGLIEMDRHGDWKLGDGKPKRGEEEDEEDEDGQHEDED